MGLMDQNEMDLFLILWNILKISLIYIFVRYLSYSHWKIHRKLTSGYLLCDKATLTLSNINIHSIVRILDCEVWRVCMRARSGGCDPPEAWKMAQASKPERMCSEYARHFPCVELGAGSRRRGRARGEGPCKLVFKIQHLASPRSQVFSSTLQAIQYLCVDLKGNPDYNSMAC
jgi:hypothetical protein